MVESNPRHRLAGTPADWDVSDPIGSPARVGLNQVDLFAGDAELAYWCLPGARGREVVPRALHARLASDAR